MNAPTLAVALILTMTTGFLSTNLSAAHPPHLSADLAQLETIFFFPGDRTVVSAKSFLRHAEPVLQSCRELIDASLSNADNSYPNIFLAETGDDLVTDLLAAHDLDSADEMHRAFVVTTLANALLNPASDGTLGFACFQRFNLTFEAYVHRCMGGDAGGEQLSDEVHNLASRIREEMPTRRHLLYAGMTAAGVALIAMLTLWQHTDDTGSNLNGKIDHNERNSENRFEGVEAGVQVNRKGLQGVVKDTKEIRKEHEVFSEEVASAIAICRAVSLVLAEEIEKNREGLQDLGVHVLQNARELAQHRLLFVEQGESLKCLYVRTDEVNQVLDSLEKTAEERGIVIQAMGDAIRNNERNIIELDEINEHTNLRLRFVEANNSAYLTKFERYLQIGKTIVEICVPMSQIALNGARVYSTIMTGGLSEGVIKGAKKLMTGLKICKECARAVGSCADAYVKVNKAVETYYEVKEEVAVLERESVTVDPRRLGPVPSRTRNPTFAQTLLDKQKDWQSRASEHGDEGGQEREQKDSHQKEPVKWA